MSTKPRIEAINRHYLITVTDMTHTRHFKIPKYIKHIIYGVATVGGLALLITNAALYAKDHLLEQENARAGLLEEQIVGVTQKNATLSSVLDAHAKELAEISEALTEVERNTGVSNNMMSSIKERLLGISDYYKTRESSYTLLGERVDEIEQVIGINEENEGQPLARRIELASLNANQEKHLHDNIPNGYPIRNRGITSNFGARLHPVTKRNAFHSGIDLRAKKPSEVFATADGIVKFANYSDQNGNLIVIQHNYGFETRYAHLKKMQVKKGEVVQKGDLIGVSGNTGRSTAPHLHYEVRYLEKAMNPEPFLRWEFGTREIFNQVTEVQWHSLINLINKQIQPPTLQLSQLELESMEKSVPQKPST